MEKLEVVNINGYRGSSYGPWAAAWRNGAGKLVALCSVVFQRQQTAEVFCEVLPLLGVPDQQDEEERIAKAIEKFIDDWDKANEKEDGTYPTPDGRYPSAKQMAEWFVAWWKGEEARKGTAV